MNEIIIAIVALVVVVFFSLRAAYRVVVRGKTVCIQEKEENSDVHLDSICEKYLRLTNID